MNNKSVMTFSFIFSLVLVSSDVSAFNLGETWGKIVDSSADVLTLGEHGRKRDQERAEQARQASEQARAKEEERLKLQVEMVTADVKLLRDVSKTFYSNYTAVDEIIKLQQGVVSISKDELGKREAAIVVIEKVRNWLREDDQSLINTVVAIGSLSFINSENVESALSTENPEKAITALSKIENDQKHAADAIKNQLEVIRQTNLSESEYLKSSLEKLRTNNLKEIINISSKSIARLSAMRVSLQSSFELYRGSLHEQVSVLAELSKVDRSTVSKIYESELPDVTSNSESIATMGKEFKVVMYATHTISDGTSTNKEQKVCMSFGGECILISH